MDEGSQEGGSRPSLPLASSSNADPKRVLLPINTITPVKRCESPQSKRVVLKELCANTFKKLSIKNKVTPTSFKSGSATPSSKQPPSSPEKDHETNVQFAREFVEELVENFPTDSVPALPVKEDTARYSIAFSDISAFSETSLPDLLQPEAQYKKQADTDTDTTDYESAVESDALSLNASLGLDRSDLVSSPDVLDAAPSPSTDLTPQVVQVDTEAFEDAEASFGEGDSTPPLDISALCLGVGNLYLETPQRPSIGSSKGDSFLVTLNSGFQGPSTDTSFDISGSDLHEFVVSASFIENSLRDSSLESELLSTTFEVAPTGESSTEYKLEIIRTLDFDLEKPVASEVEVQLPVEKAPTCDRTELLAEEPVSRIVESETADVEAIQSVETEFVDSQVTYSLEAVQSEPQAVFAEDTVEAGNDLQPQSEGETELLNSSLVEADLEVGCVELQKSQLAVCEVASTPSSNTVSTQEADSSATELVEPTLPTVEGSVTDVLPAPEPELSLQEEKSIVIKPESVPSELVQTVGETATEVLLAPESDLSLAAVYLTESASTVDNKTVSSTEPESSDSAERSLIVEKPASIVDSQESTCVAVPAQAEPALELCVIPEHEFANAASTVGPQAGNESIIQSPKSELIVNLSHIENKQSVKEDLPTVGIKEKELYLEPTIESENLGDLAGPQVVIVESTENNLIIVSSDIPNKGPVKFEHFQETEPNASAFVDLNLEPKRAISPCQISADEPELLAFSSEPVNFSASGSIDQAGRKCTISPSFLLLGDNTLNQQVLAVPTDSVLTPLPTHQRHSASSRELADLIDPVGAVWSRDVDKSSRFSLPSHRKNPKQDPDSPQINPIQFRASPLYPQKTDKNEAFPSVRGSRQSLVLSGDPFSPVSIKKELKTEISYKNENLEGGDSCHITTKSFKSTNTIEDQSLNDLREICQRQQRELDNQQFSSGFFAETGYNSVAIANIASEAARVSEDIHNACIEKIELEMDENVNPVPLDKKWLSERRDPGAKTDAREMAKSRNILGGGDGFADSLDKQNKNIMTASIDAQTNQSEAGPEIALQDEDESFADSEGFDFLSAKASTGPSDRLVRESLYTKFDPLAAPLTASTPAPAATPAVRHAPLPMPPKFSENDKKISPPAGQLIQLAPTPVLSKPPRSSTPCANEGPTETTPPKSSAARALVDRLISLSPAGRNVQESPVKPPPPVVKAPTPTPQTMEGMSEELVLLRELLSEEDMAHKVSLVALEEKLKSTELELQAMRQRAKTAEEREQKLMARFGEKVTSQKQIAGVMCQYEKTISKLVGEKESDRVVFLKEREEILKEKDVALGHLTNIEIAFSDVHQKYERCKTVVEAFKSNEDVLRESLAKYESTVHKQEQKYEMLKAHAMTQLENANQELDSVRRTQATESAKLKAMLKKSELKTSSLEEMLEQKVKENLELASICDDLIAKVGT